MVFRVLISMNKNVFRSLEPTDAIKAAYARNEDLKVMSHRFVADLSAESKFCVYAFHYVPEAGEIQLTVRINRGSVKEEGSADKTAFALRNSATDGTTPGTVLNVRDWMMYRFYRISFKATISDGDSYGVILTRGGAVADEFVLHQKDQEFSERSLTAEEKKTMADG